MKCDAFWGLDGPPHKYIIEFSKEELEKMTLIPTSKEFEHFGKKIWEKLMIEYTKHAEADKPKLTNWRTDCAGGDCKDGWHDDDRWSLK